MPGPLVVVPSVINELRDASIVDTLSDRQIEEWMPGLYPKWTKYIPHIPTPQQWAFLLLDCREAMYGGAVGGGKSDALLMAALQYVDVPGYAALLLRRSFADLEKAGALIPRSHEWLGGTDAHWQGDRKRWVFPSGATLEFGYCDHDTHLNSYQGGAWQFVGFDELTQFMLRWYTYIGFSRVRKLAGVNVPVRTRGATNPGGEGHDWVKQRFLVSGPSRGRVFIPAKLEDNPHLDTEDYDKSLDELDPTLKAQLRHGDWETLPPGDFFNRDWIHIIDEHEAPPNLRWSRSWDIAATKNRTSAYTAGVKFSVRDGSAYVSNVRRQRGDPGETETMIKHTAEVDGKQVVILIEQEGGSGGINTIWRYQRTVLFGYNVIAYKPRMDKLLRARPLSATARYGGLYVIRSANGDNSWIEPYIQELHSFPNGFKDQVDASSQAFDHLTTTPEPRVRSL